MRRFRPAALLFIVAAVLTSSLGVVAATLQQLPVLRRADAPQAAATQSPLVVRGLAVPSTAPAAARRSLPPFPPMPRNQSGKRRIRSAYGSNYTITQVSGCTQAASSQVYPQNC